MRKAHVCPKCDGKKTFLKQENMDFSPFSIPYWKSETCSFCEGCGCVWVEPIQPSPSDSSLVEVDTHSFPSPKSSDT